VINESSAKEKERKELRDELLTGKWLSPFLIKQKDSKLFHWLFDIGNFSFSSIPFSSLSFFFFFFFSFIFLLLFEYK